MMPITDGNQKMHPSILMLPVTPLKPELFSCQRLALGLNVPSWVQGQPASWGSK